MMKLVVRATAAVSLALAAAGCAQSPGKASAQVGKVEFQNSCSPAVQEKLLSGIAMLHSFYYSAAEKAFEEVAAEDNRCAIAAWGFASILMSNPLAGQGASAKDGPRAQGAIDKGRLMGAKTERERDYLEAVAAYYEDFAGRPERARQLSRAKAYEALAAKYPDDDEAQIFSALYLAGTQLQSDQTYAAYLKAAAIPRRYAQIAPDVPHALHMPSHIFTRVGEWTESAATNRRSSTVAQKNNEPDEALHALDYMTYALLQMARDGDARKALDEAQQIKGITPRFIAPYALTAMPARYALERGDWRAAAELQPRQDNFPFTVAMTHFARALGAARSGDAASAQKDADRIAALGAELKAASNAYWAGEVEVMRLASFAWTALAQNRNDEALGLMRQAADLEDKSEKHIVTPARLVPARELLGDMLLEQKRPAEALKEYEASQVREPNRYRGFYGAGMAASQSGNTAKAKQHFSRLVEMAGSAGSRAEVGSARAYLARN